MEHCTGQFRALNMHELSSDTQSLRSWLLKLRLVAFVGQVTLILAAVVLLEVKLPLLPLLALLALIPVSHLFYRYLVPRCSTAYILIFDTLLLTALLFFAGGAANPFSVVYLVHVVLAAVLLGAAWAWIMAGVTTLNFAALFFLGQEQSATMHHGMAHAGHELSIHLYGMLGAYALVAMLVAYFLSHIITALKKREELLLQLESDKKQLATVTSWAAQAAHQLGSPLSTMRVVVNDLLEELEVGKRVSREMLLEDLTLLDGETLRCKEIIDSLCKRAGSIRGEAPTWTGIDSMLEESLASYLPGVTFLFSNCREGEFKLPSRALGACLEALVQNGLDIHQELGESRPIEVFVGYDSHRLTFQVRDYGPGISKALQERCFDPFFTTKEKGMGLGLFIARLVCQSIEATLSFQSRDDTGHVATVSLPSVEFREGALAA